MGTQAGKSDLAGTEWSDATKRTVAIGGVLVGVFVLYISRPVIPFIILAAILAFLLNPVVDLFSLRLRMPRWLAVLLAYLLLLVAMVLLPLILTPAVINAVRDIDVDMVDLLVRSTAWLQKSLEGIRDLEVLNYRIELAPVVDPALEMLGGVVPEAMIPSPERIFSSIPSALELATGFASTVVSTVVWAILGFLFTLIYAIYLSLDLPRFANILSGLVPEQYRAEYTQLGNLVLSVWAAFFRGQLILALIIGVIVGVGNAALGVPAALLLGILAGLLEALPNIGPIFALIVTLFYFIVQQLENNIIVPRLIGQAVDLPPVLIMAGVVVGASVGGILGAFMAAPLIATGRIVAQYAYNKVAGRPPFVAGRVLPAVRVETVSIDSVAQDSIALAAEEGHPAAEPPVSVDPGAPEAAREVKSATPSVESLEG